MIVAIWGLETDFGANSGKFPTIRALASLAYDCRRPDKFRSELLAAMRIVERGDMAPADMHGAWAGEIGQTQFLPSSYLKYAVDYDGNGRRDLIHSVPDVLASTANYLKGYGWKAGQPWGEGTENFQVLLQWNASQIYTKINCHQIIFFHFNIIFTFIILSSIIHCNMIIFISCCNKMCFGCLIIFSDIII